MRIFQFEIQRKKSKSIKLFALIHLLILTASVFYAEEFLPKWKMSLQGNVIAEPADTTYGFAAVTDGNTVASIDFSGNKIYELHLRRPPSSVFLITKNDMLCILSRKKDTLSLYNPEGHQIWERKLSLKSADVQKEKNLRLIEKDGHFLLFNADYESRNSKLLAAVGTNGKLLSMNAEYIFTDDENETEKTFLAEYGFVKITEDKKAFTAEGFSKTNDILFKRTFSKSDYKMLFYTQNDFLITFDNNWIVSAYEPYPVFRNKKYEHKLEATAKKNAVLKSERMAENLTETLPDEIIRLKEELKSNEKLGLQKIVYQKKNTRDYESEIEAIRKAADSGFDFSTEIAMLIDVETEPSVLKELFSYSVKCGFDPEYKILQAADEFIERNKGIYTDSQIYTGICDAVIGITQYMGIDAMNMYGKQILLELRSPYMSDTVKTEVRNTLKKMYSLQ